VTVFLLKLKNSLFINELFKSNFAKKKQYAQKQFTREQFKGTILSFPQITNL
jgi:hypothetical protein